MDEQALQVPLVNQRRRYGKAGQGSRDRGLFERPKGSGIWWIRYHDGDGHEHREKIGTKSLARRVYEKRKTEIRDGRYFPPENKIAVRFDEIAADYKAAAQKDGREIIRGEIGYRRLQECFGGMAADSIASSYIEAFRDRLGEDLSPATVNLHLKLLRAIFIRAVRAQTVSSNPVSRVRFCKENNKRLRWLSEEEENALFASLPD